jgi:hypothetical protein
MPSQRALGKRRARSPDDTDDSDYEPTPKQVKTSERSRNRGAGAAKASKGPRNITEKGATILTTDTANTQKPALDDRDSPAIVLDELPENPRAEASTKAPDADNDKRRTGPVPGGDEVATVISAHEYEAGESSGSGRLDRKIDACLSILTRLVNHQTNLSDETMRHIRHLISASSDPNGSLVENLVKELDSQRALKARYYKMSNELIGSIDYSTGLVFPKEPTYRKIEESWTDIYQHLVDTVGPNNTRPFISVLSAGYVVGFAENIATGRVSNDQLDSYIESVSGPLKSPHAKQTLFSALFCRWVFAAPEPMLHAMHSDGMMHLYENRITGASDIVAGLSEVRHHDMAAAKLLFEDRDFQDVEVKERIAVFESGLQKFKEERCQESNFPSAKSPSEFAKDVFEFKQSLLISTKEYRIHYVRPGVPFDPRWMQAYDTDNFSIPAEKITGRKVLLCLFPALTCGDAKPMTDETEMSEILVKNKRFFPKFGEDVDLSVRVFKAAVLLQKP